MHWTSEQLDRHRQACIHKWKVVDVSDVLCDTPEWKGQGTAVYYACEKCSENKDEILQGSWTISQVLHGKDVLKEFSEFMDNVNPSDFAQH